VLWFIRHTLSDVYVLPVRCRGAMRNARAVWVVFSFVARKKLVPS
jgi:hypothetical protein